MREADRRRRWETDPRGRWLLRVSPLRLGVRVRDGNGIAKPSRRRNPTTSQIRKRINKAGFRPRSVPQRRRPLQTLRLDSRDRSSFGGKAVALLPALQLEQLRGRLVFGWGRQSCRPFLFVSEQISRCRSQSGLLLFPIYCPIDLAFALISPQNRVSAYFFTQIAILISLC